MHAVPKFKFIQIQHLLKLNKLLLNQLLRSVNHSNTTLVKVKC